MRFSRFVILYFLVLSLLGGGLVLLVTSRYGAGVSADAVKNLSTAASLLAGKGFFDHTGAPLVYWPPLYPLLLAGISALTGWDVFVSGWYLNVLVMMANVFLGGMLIYEAMRERPIYVYLGGLFLVVSESAVRIHANVSSDPLYITFSLVFLLGANRYMEKKSMGALWMMIACAALATLQRWLGTSLIAMGGLVILVVRWKDWGKFLRDGFLMGISLLPVGSWIYFHNILKYGTFWGNDSPTLNPWINFTFSLTKIIHWFLPYHPRLDFILYRPLIVLGVILLILLVVARRQDWAKWWQTLWQPNVFPVVFFLPLSLVGIALVIVTGDHQSPFSDRYYVGFMPSVIILSFITLDILVLPRLRFDLLKSRTVVAILFGVWLLLYPAYGMYKYISISMENGETSTYNYYNIRSYIENPAVQVIKDLETLNPDAYFYSNYADGFWFLTRHSTLLMPRTSVTEMNSTVVREKFNGWPGDKPGYILWFLPNEYKHVIPPELLAEVADVKLIFASEQGMVYSVEAK